MRSVFVASSFLVHAPLASREAGDHAAWEARGKASMACAHRERHQATIGSDHRQRATNDRQRRSTATIIIPRSVYAQIIARRQPLDVPPHEAEKHHRGTAPATAPPPRGLRALLLRCKAACATDRVTTRPRAPSSPLSSLFRAAISCSAFRVRNSSGLRSLGPSSGAAHEQYSRSASG